MSNFVVSFPKSGRTWIRALLGYLVCSKNSLDVKSIFDEKILIAHEKNFPTFTHDNVQRNKIPFSQVIKNKQNHIANDRVVFLTRNPIDVMVSYYFHYRFRDAAAKFKGYNGSISSFIHGKYCWKKLNRLLTFNGMWTSEKYDNVIVVTYENIHAQGKLELEKIIRFFDFSNIMEEDIEKSLKFCSFENMHNMEKNGVFEGDFFTPSDKDDSRTYKTREGKVGGYVNHLEESDILFINDKIAGIEKRLFDLRKDKMGA